LARDGDKYQSILSEELPDACLFCNLKRKTTIRKEITWQERFYRLPGLTQALRFQKKQKHSLHGYAIIDYNEMVITREKTGFELEFG
jgi:hypothetical protein